MGINTTFRRQNFPGRPGRVGPGEAYQSSGKAERLLAFATRNKGSIDSRGSGLSVSVRQRSGNGLSGARRRGRSAEWPASGRRAGNLIAFS